MAEIMLAPGRPDLIVAKKLAETNQDKLFGAKVLINDSYVVSDGSERHGRYGAVACILKRAGIRRIMIDSKIPNDTPFEMRDLTNSIVAGYAPADVPSRKNDRPEFMTVHFTAPRKSLSMFRDSTLRLGITPVCFTTSSRYDEQDYLDLGSSSSEFVKRSTESISELGFRAVLCAACDAEAIKVLNPDLVVFGTGAVMSMDDNTTQSRVITYEDSADFVDVFIEGTSILQAPDPQEALEARLLFAN